MIDDDDDEKRTQRMPNFLPSINILCFFLNVYLELLSNENCKAKTVFDILLKKTRWFRKSRSFLQITARFYAIQILSVIFISTYYLSYSKNSCGSAVLLQIIPKC